MFEASFIFHAWGNDISSGTAWPHLDIDWTAAPLGYDCQHPNPWTANDPRYCPWTKRQRGHAATGSWSRSIGTGTPPKISMAQSDFGVQLVTKTAGNTWGVGDCCRGLFPHATYSSSYPVYWQSFSYATFVNAAGTFFAGGGAAAAKGYVNKTGATAMTAGTWQIRAGKNAFGGVMGLLGKYGGKVIWTDPWGEPGWFVTSSSWNMVNVLGRPLFNTVIRTGDFGTLYYQNPYAHMTLTYKGHSPSTYLTTRNIGSGTLWTTGQVGNFTRVDYFTTSLWRTGYDNRTPQGKGNIQLVTPTLTHWLNGYPFEHHTAQVGMLTIQVPEPGAILLLAAGAGVLVFLRRVSRRR
jgi:hypothetical protein